MVASGLATPLPAMSGAEPWLGSVQALAPGVQRGRRQHADGTGEHGGRVRQDVAEHAAGEQHVKLLGALTSCIAALSTYMWSSSMSGTGRAPQ